ncbi:RNase H domain-containing protein [Trichonephila clavipes]|nr:RNase H domain-containing protein [Trichonephila clavipes]
MSYASRIWGHPLNGSKWNGRVGLACVIYEEGIEYVTFQHRLRDECSVFQAELLCINLAVKLIQDSLRQGGMLNFLICTVSLSSLHCLLNVNYTEKLVVEVQSILYYLDCDIHFSCVRGHSRNLGNDRADRLAKETTCEDMNLLMYVPLSHWKHLSWERTVSSWNTEFLTSPKALWTKRFIPTIYQRLKCKNFVTDFKLFQILTVHGNFNNYLSRFNLIGSDMCSRGQAAETVEHTTPQTDSKPCNMSILITDFNYNVVLETH